MDKTHVAGMQVAHRRNEADAFAHALPFFGKLLHCGDGGGDSHTRKVSVETRPINAIVGFVMLMKYVGSTRLPPSRRAKAPLRRDGGRRVPCGVPPHGLSGAGIILFE
jgi:hypothetical protein